MDVRRDEIYARKCRGGNAVAASEDYKTCEYCSRGLRSECWLALASGWSRGGESPCVEALEQECQRSSWKSIYRKVAFLKKSLSILRPTCSFLTRDEAIRYPLCRVPGDITTRKRAHVSSAPSVNEPANENEHPSPW